MLLKYGVLGLLIERRGYGYELVQRLGRRLGAAWQLNPSTVYTALDQLEHDGHICRVDPAREGGSVVGSRTAGPPARERDKDLGQRGERRVPRSERGARRSERVVYAATGLGEQEFQRWLERPSARVDPIRSEIQLKVALAGPDNVPSLLSAIAQDEWILRRLHQECLAASGGPVPAEEDGASTTGEDWPRAASALVNAAAARQLEGQLQWIQAVRETLQRLSVAQLMESEARSGALDRGPMRGSSAAAV